ncbi:hypothetical protein MRX96_047874, partial [Rhipicephalus microplus]
SGGGSCQGPSGSLGVLLKQRRRLPPPALATFPSRHTTRSSREVRQNRKLRNVRRPVPMCAVSGLPWQLGTPSPRQLTGLRRASWARRSRDPTISFGRIATCDRRAVRDPD